MLRRDRPIGRSLALGFGGAGVLLAALLGVAVTLQARIGWEASRQLEHIAPVSAAATRLEAATLYVAVTARSYAVSPGAETERAFEAAVAALHETVGVLRDLRLEGAEAAALGSALEAVPRYAGAARDLAAAVRQGLPRDELQAREAAMRPVREATLERVRALRHLQEREARAASAAILDIQAATRWWLLGAFTAVSALLAAAALGTARGVREPARALVAASRRLAMGDYGAVAELHPPERPRSEFGRLAQAFTAMADALRDREERLAAQNEELQVQNEELRAQEEELHAQNEELQVQQGELRAHNDALAREVGAREAAEAKLREAMETLARADRRKDEFLGVLSHELRNPLAPVVNAVRILERPDAPPEAAARARGVLGRQVAHLGRMVDDLLDVVRITRGKIQLRRGDVDLGEAARRVAEDLRSVFQERGVALEVRTPARGCWVNADPARIEQIISNLLQNAAKFTDRGRTVTLEVEGGPGGVVLRVRDDGIGMSREVLDRLFEPFVQADGSLARTRGGLGLGLSLVKGLVELHGGRVTAMSEGEGLGSEFVVELPAVEPPKAPDRATEPAGGPRRRVLVVEDNVDSAETLRDVLELAGHAAEVAFDARTALERARAGRPDAILCDLGLPDVDGYELARRFRDVPGLSNTLLVALSGYARPEDLARARSAGFHAHLAKPATLESIEALLRDAGGRAQG